MLVVWCGGAVLVAGWCGMVVVSAGVVDGDYGAATAMALLCAKLR